MSFTIIISTKSQKTCFSGLYIDGFTSFTSCTWMYIIQDLSVRSVSVVWWDGQLGTSVAEEDATMCCCRSFYSSAAAAVVIVCYC